ncbi:hypothetical protein HW555_000440 [Spodoptera exigua]|uniref:HAT C-terminal dimerisation domain-containing protein n=1 Tax=Spodoptera exigua TaxID=7107 RepID=A0A835LG70_SPOEX|nr:hypothetical protein HW555_000440 [Spodoptera exigua]
MLSFLSFTVHWLDNNFVLQHGMLKIKSFSEQHTAHNIQCALEEIAESWNISDKIHVIVTDNGRNIVKAVNDSPFEGKTCFIHTLQRAIHGALDAQESVAQRSTSSSNCENTHRTFWSCYEELAAVKLPIDVEETKSPIASELDRYLSEVLLLKDLCPYGWWAKNKDKFPNMSCLARTYLSCHGSSVYSERLFSEAGNVYEKKRNKLLPDKAESLVFLHHNLPLVNFEYE